MPLQYLGQISKLVSSTLIDTRGGMVPRQEPPSNSEIPIYVPEKDTHFSVIGARSEG